jgi:hypothetical protein
MVLLSEAGYIYFAEKSDIDNFDYNEIMNRCPEKSNTCFLWICNKEGEADNINIELGKKFNIKTNCIWKSDYSVYEIKE